jgi:hypothetical protein
MSAHRVRAERAFGRALPARAVVHHADGSKNIDAPLVICEDTAYHNLLHMRTRTFRAGGNPDADRICLRCRVVKRLVEFGPAPSKPMGRKSWCRPCENSYKKDRRSK